MVRIVSLAALTILLSGWTTCNGMFAFNSCQDSVPQPQVTSLSPDTIRGDAESTLLVVNGGGFVPQSLIMWNGNALRTVFVDSRQLQTTITQPIFDSLGGTAGSVVRISVKSPHGVSDLECPISGNSTTLVLVIN